MLNSLNISPSIAASHVDENLVLVDETTSAVFVYGPVAGVVWESLRASSTVDDLVECVSQRFVIDNSQNVRADILELLSKWIENRILERPNPSPASKTQALDQHSVHSPSDDWFDQWLCTIKSKIFQIFVHDYQRSRLLRQVFNQHYHDNGTRPCVLKVWAHEGDLVIAKDGVPIIVSDAADDLLSSMLQLAIDEIYIDMRLKAILHASGVARDGIGIAFPAPSGGGKSMLAAAFIARGFRYFGDDLVLVSDPGHQIVPWPSPIAIRQEGWPILADRIESIDQMSDWRRRGRKGEFILGMTNALSAEPAVLSYLIFPCRAPGTPATLMPLTSIEALDRLVRDRVWIDIAPSVGKLENFLGWLVSAEALLLRYDELNDAVSIVEAMLSRHRS